MTAALLAAVERLRREGKTYDEVYKYVRERREQFPKGARLLTAIKRLPR